MCLPPTDSSQQRGSVYCRGRVSIFIGRSGDRKKSLLIFVFHFWTARLRRRRDLLTIPRKIYVTVILPLSRLSEMGLFFLLEIDGDENSEGIDSC